MALGSVAMTPLAQLRAAVQAERAARGESLHRRITDQLAGAIASGELPAGTQLPPEVALAQYLGVSRHTVRMSLSELVRAGLLARRKRAGTQVRQPPIEQRLSGFYSLAGEMQARGLRLDTQVLARGRFGLDDTIGAVAARQLQVAVPTEVGYLVRLRLVDDVPLVLETLTFPADVCPPLLVGPELGVGRAAAADLGAAGFYETLARCAGMHVTQARETIRAEVAAGDDARRLGIDQGAPVFVVERTGFVDMRPVEWRESRIRGDRYRFVAELVNPADDEASQRQVAATSST